ncbi:FAD/NAD(P)-binding protein [Streptomyces sp. NPDC005859]|uniref:FAD/NAD(P)-binding protein n=1 Tax=Streptomyces sp. NPDC005859 TaxID=3157170 RepID=UPI0033E30230
MSIKHLSLCIVGVGPRGLSVLERLCANARHLPSSSNVRVYLVDPYPAGAGAVWRTDQSRLLLMNTVACQITVFTDDSVSLEGPVEPGPSLYEWAEELRKSSGAAVPAGGEQTLAEARNLGPDSYPTRAFFGSYLREMFARICLGAPPQVDIVMHYTRAVALNGVQDGGQDGAATQSVLLENGRLIEGLDSVILSQGHVDAEPSRKERLLAAQAEEHGLTYVPPASPADLDLGFIGAGENVLLRGLGLCFFDHMALLTSGRGGRFVPHGEKLVYEPSGREPRLFATSRRGVPYQARGENEKGPHGRYFPRLLTEAFLADLRKRAEDGDRVYFGVDIWPLIAREVESVYYSTLLERWGRSADRKAFVELYLAAAQEEHRVEILDAYGFPGESRWDWERVSRPCFGREFADRDDFHAWLMDYLEEDVRHALGGNVSNPLKAALDVLRDLRNEVRLAVDHGGLDGNSHRDELDGWYTPLNAFLSIGPPAFRIKQMMALIQAGVLRLSGPGAGIRVDSAARTFVCDSPEIAGPPIEARVLVEARLPEPDVRRPADPLMRQLLEDGYITPFRIEGSCAVSYETGGLAVTRRPCRVLDAQGRVNERLFAYGVPTESVHWVTAAAVRPGVDSVSLGDADAIARAVLAAPPSTATVTAPATATARTEDSHMEIRS